MTLAEGVVPMPANCGTKEKSSELSESQFRGKGKTNVKRYNMLLPEPVYEEIKEIADKNGVTIVEVLRKFIKLGFIVDKVENTPGLELVLREEGKPDKTIILI